MPYGVASAAPLDHMSNATHALTYDACPSLLEDKGICQGPSQPSCISASPLETAHVVTAQNSQALVAHNLRAASSDSRFRDDILAVICRHGDETASREDLLRLWESICESDKGDRSTKDAKRCILYAFFARFNEPIGNSFSSSQKSAQRIDALQKYEAGQVSRGNRQEIQSTLETWFDYISESETSLLPLLEKIVEKRMEMSEEKFHSAENSEFKKLYKRLNIDMNHLSAAKYACGQMQGGIEGNEIDKFRVFSSNNKIEALLKYQDLITKVDYLAADPRNIVPDFDQTSVARGLARATLSLAVLEARKEHGGMGADISLIAHNSKTKRVYNALGFEVPGVGSKPESSEEHGSLRMLKADAKRKFDDYQALEERLTVSKDQDIPTETELLAAEAEVVAAEEKMERFQKRTPWHAKDTMYLPVNKQQALVDRSRLNVPRELEEYVSLK
ncbi:MAG: hypothetical protein ACR2RF_24065 [Geminicoccaceae bacterium]